MRVATNKWIISQEKINQSSSLAYATTNLSLIDFNKNNSLKNTLENIIEKQRQLPKKFHVCNQLERYNIGVQEDVHSQISVDGSKSIAQFLKVIECMNNPIIMDNPIKW